ncbi:MAG: type ISP restriction/modification enzyme [Bacteroidota bacterium]
MKIFETYIHSLQKFNIDEVTEHTYRRELHDLLENISNTYNAGIIIQHEPKRKEGFGAPDFKIKTKGEAIVGYVENKKLTEDLSRTVKSDQLKKYQSLSRNIILTNYIEWYWIRDSKVIASEKLCELGDLESKMAIILDPEKTEKVRNIIIQFYSQTPQGISKPKQLAEALAIRARFLRDFLHEELKRQEKEDPTGRLYGLYDTFTTNIFHELTQKEFADAFSQTLVYGLFLSKLNANNKTIDLYNAKQFILPAFGLISELVSFLDVLENRQYVEAKWIIEEILSVMNTLDLASITRNLSYEKFKTTNLFDEENISYHDPYIYFYEHFLAAYDKALRKAKGVYYTPPQVVSFIVRSIHDILINIFGIGNGYADKDRITVLDFATGTGTFLLEILEIIFDELPKGSGKKNLLIRDHILKNFYGFEYLIAPYAVANLKLSQFLKEQGYDLEDDDRFQIYLTNTLEPIDPQIKIPLLPTLTKESKAAQEVKDNPILVITGNPPYAGHSRNPSEKTIVTSNKKGKQGKRKIKTWIGERISTYRFVDGQPLGERNPKWLQDDYVKFIRFAQWKMDQVEEGIVGIITNHRFISNPTFRGMRQSLMNSFNQIHILDLHGSNKPKEFAPDGSPDENVFDVIQQGVAISFFIKKPGLQKKIVHADLFGKRIEKYDFCQKEGIDTVKWTKIKPESPHYLFIQTDKSQKNDYDNGIPIKKIFDQNVTGFYTGHDDIAIAFDKSSLKEKVKSYNKEITFNQDYIKTCLYRPFDNRYVYYSKAVVNRHRPKVMPSMLQPNYGLAIGRAGSAVTKEFMWNLVFVSDKIIDLNLFYRGGANIFPLYLYENESKQSKQQVLEFSKPESKRNNLTASFRALIDSKYKKSPSAEQIFGYVYAILYSPTYRRKYRAFLDIDFPKIPITDNEKNFQDLSKLGWDIIYSHIMKKDPDKSKYTFGDLKGIGDCKVERREFIPINTDKGMGKLHINATQYFDNIPTSVYELYIGGYQVLDKYLKDRNGRTLNLAEVDNIEKVIRVLSFTEDKMKEIDDMTKNWI